MINSLGQDLTAYLTGLMTPTGKLMRFKSVSEGDILPRTEDQPAATVDWDDQLQIDRNGNARALGIVVAVTLYTSSLEGELEAGRVHQQALIEAVPGGKFRGLLPALLLPGDVYIQTSGQAWDYELRFVPRVTTKSARSWLTFQTIEITFAALFNQSQFD